MSSSRSNRAPSVAPETVAAFTPGATERPRHLQHTPAEAVAIDLSEELCKSCARHGVEHFEIAAALGVSRQYVSRACNRAEPRHTLGAHYAALLCQHPDARLRAVGVDYLRAVVALAGLGAIVEHRHAQGTAVARMALVQREASEGVLALIEAHADGHESQADLVRIERECQQGADALQAEAMRARGLRMQIVNE
jgi:hypothetical protein